MFDPSLGRWMTEDPIGFEGGDTNLYRYVGNNPANFTDPSGLYGIFFDGATFTGRDNSVITQMRNVYPASNSAIYHFSNTRETIFSGDVFNQQVEAAYNQVIQIRQARPNEPIDIFGFSRGGVAAIRLARRLQQAGIPVRYMVLIDPSTSGMYRTADDRMSDATFAGGIPSNVRTVIAAYATGKPKPNLSSGPFMPYWIRRQIRNFQPTIDDPTRTSYHSVTFPNIEHWECATDSGFIGAFAATIRLHTGGAINFGLLIGSMSGGGGGGGGGGEQGGYWGTGGQWVDTSRPPAPPSTITEWVWDGNDFFQVERPNIIKPRR